MATWSFHWFILGKCGPCDNFKNACFFLMKLATCIESKVENMHILLLCLPNINFGCYGNLKLPLAYNERMWILQYMDFVPMTWWGSYFTKDMLSSLSSSEPGGFKESPGGMLHPLHFIKGLISQKPFRSPSLNHIIFVPYAKTHPVTPAGDSLGPCPSQ